MHLLSTLTLEHVLRMQGPGPPVLWTFFCFSVILHKSSAFLRRRRGSINVAVVYSIGMLDWRVCVALNDVVS